MQALQRLGIEALAQRGIGTISGGERQLALMARALVQNAEILIMDEPTANLDFGNQQRVLAQIRALTARGYTVLLSTHNPEHALHYADVYKRQSLQRPGSACRSAWRGTAAELPHAARPDGRISCFLAPFPEIVIFS